MVVRECRTGRCGRPAEPEIQGNVVKVDGDRGHQRGGIKPAGRLDQARQDQQAKRGRGQMGGLIERGGAQRAGPDRPVGRVEPQRHHGEQDRAGAAPDQIPSS